DDHARVDSAAEERSKRDIAHEVRLDSVSEVFAQESACLLVGALSVDVLRARFPILVNGYAVVWAPPQDRTGGELLDCAERSDRCRYVTEREVVAERL